LIYINGGRVYRFYDPNIQAAGGGETAGRGAPPRALRPAAASQPAKEKAVNERLALLRRKIDLLRGYLREGVELGVAATYLREIAEAEWELRHLEGLLEREPC
jgi:hypothetical protein